MNQVIGTIIKETNAQIGSEAAKRIKDYGVEIADEVYQKVKDMLFPEETTLEISNKFCHHAPAFGSQATAETRAAMETIIKLQNFWITTKFGCGKEPSSLGLEYPLPNYYLRLGVAATSPAVNPKLIFKVLYETEKMRGLAEICLDTSGSPYCTPSLLISSTLGCLKVSKEKDEIGGSVGINIATSGYVEAEVVHRTAAAAAGAGETDFGLAVTIKDFKGVNVGVFGKATIGPAHADAAGKLTKVGGEITKMHNGIKYMLKADSKTDGTDAKIGFGWSTT